MFRPVYVHYLRNKSIFTPLIGYPLLSQKLIRNFIFIGKPPLFILKYIKVLLFNYCFKSSVYTNCKTLRNNYTHFTRIRVIYFFYYDNFGRVDLYPIYAINTAQIFCILHSKLIFFIIGLQLCCL